MITTKKKKKKKRIASPGDSFHLLLPSLCSSPSSRQGSPWRPGAPVASNASPVCLSSHSSPLVDNIFLAVIFHGLPHLSTPLFICNGVPLSVFFFFAFSTLHFPLLSTFQSSLSTFFPILHIPVLQSPPSFSILLYFASVLHYPLLTNRLLLHSCLLFFFLLVLRLSLLV